MESKVEIGAVSIVLVGGLNPAIFTPGWFAKNEIISDELADTAKIEIVHNEITSFSTEWFTLKAEHVVDYSRIIFTTELEPYINLCDLVVKTFGDFLFHSPLSMVGINKEAHYSVPSLDALDKLGFLLAPKEPWGKWGSDIGTGDGLKHGGMSQITMEKRELEDRDYGHIKISVEKSGRLDCGVLMKSNDHFEIREHDKLTGCDEVLNFLSGHFDESMTNVDSVFNHIMSNI